MKLLRLIQPGINRLVYVITGHTGLQANLYRKEIESDDSCGARGKESDHYLFQCLTFLQIRFRHFGTNTSPDITHLVGTSYVRRITTIIKERTTGLIVTYTSHDMIRNYPSIQSNLI